VQHFGMRIGESQALDVRGAVAVLVQQMQVSAGAAVDEQWLELLARLVTLQVTVICKVFRRVLVEVGVDVLRCLLAADAETLYQMTRGQTAFSPGDRLYQAVTQGQIPADLADRLLAFHTRLICWKTLQATIG